MTFHDFVAFLSFVPGRARYGSIAAFVAVLSCVIAAPAFAQVTSGAQSQNLVPNARAQGMGRAFTAIAEGPNAAWWNPGALGMQPSLWMSPWSTAHLVPDLADDVHVHSYGVAGSYRGFGAGFHYTDLDYGESEAVTEDGQVVGSFVSTEYTRLFGVGVEALELITGRTQDLQVGLGANFKWFWVDLAPDWALPEHLAGKADATDIDLGMLVTYRIDLESLGDADWKHDSYLRFRFGAAKKNAHDNRLDYDQQTISDPLVVRDHVGFAVEGSFGRLEPLGPVIQGFLAFDNLSVDHFTFGRRDRDIQHYGAEVKVLNVVALRYGRIEDKDGQIQDYTIGFGLAFAAEPPDGVLGQIHVGYDFASVPQATGLERVQYHTFGFGVQLR